MKKIERRRGQARRRAEYKAQPGVDTEAGQDERRCHHQLQSLIQPDADPMRGGYHPMQTWAIMMESGRAEFIVNGGKPTGPVDALLKGALDGRRAVEMRQYIPCLNGDPVDLPERTGDNNGKQRDEEDDPEAKGKTDRHCRKYTDS